MRSLIFWPLAPFFFLEHVLILSQLLSGIVKQELKSTNQAYGGLIAIKEAEGRTDLETVRFSSTSMAEKRTLNQNDPVCFQLATHKKTGAVRAYNVQCKFYVLMKVNKGLK